MRIMLKRKRLSTKIVLVYTALVLVMIVCSVGILSVYTSQTIQEYTLNSMKTAITINSNQLDRMCLNVERVITMMKMDSSMLADRDEVPELFSLLLTYQPAETVDEFIQYRNKYVAMRDKMQEYFSIALDRQASFRCAFFADESLHWDFVTGRIADGIMPAQSGIYSSSQLYKTFWYALLPQDYNTHYFTANADSGVIYLVRRVAMRNSTSNLSIEQRDMGILILAMDVSNISGNMQFSSQEDEPVGMLMDREGNILFQGRNDMPADDMQQCIQKAQHMPNTEDFQHIKTDGMEYLLKVDQINDELRVLTIVPYQNLWYSFADSVKVTVHIAVITLIAGIILIITLSKHLTRPTSTLAAHMQSKTLTHLPVPDHLSAELDVLYTSFNQYIEDINHLIVQNKEVAEKQRQAELNFLLAQINPHFIYNTLDSVCCLAMGRQCDDIAAVLKSLAQMMRYNIKNPTDMVRVEDEIRIIRQYENIERCCYGDYLRFDYMIDEATLNLLLPKLIIQPLVENAIIHGIGNQTECVSVEIKCLKEGQQMRIRVRDSGKVADISRINHFIEVEDEQDVQQTDSIGIRNIRHRLTMAYGQRAIFRYLKDPMGCTMAEIILPIDESNEKGEKP